MGTPPAKITTSTPSPVASPSKPVPVKKKLNCFVMPNKPDHPGLVIVSTDKTQDGCYVLDWHTQSTNWVASDGPQWYALAGHVSKVTFVGEVIFGFLLLVVLVINRVR